MICTPNFLCKAYDSWLNFHDSQINSGYRGYTSWLNSYLWSFSLVTPFITFVVRIDANCNAPDSEASEKRLNSQQTAKLTIHDTLVSADHMTPNSTLTTKVMEHDLTNCKASDSWLNFDHEAFDLQLNLSYEGYDSALTGKGQICDSAPAAKLVIKDSTLPENLTTRSRMRSLRLATLTIPLMTGDSACPFYEPRTMTDDSPTPNGQWFCFTGWPWPHAKHPRDENI